MNYEAHLQALHNKHDKIEQEIRESYLQHADDETIKKLKIMKMKINEEIELCKEELKNS
jgi:hypothetical protein